MEDSGKVNWYYLFFLTGWIRRRIRDCMGRPRIQGMTCLLPDCNNPPRAKGLCEYHYRFARNHGLSRTFCDNRGKTCYVEGCFSQAKEKGLCHTHIARIHRNGDLILRPSGAHRVPLHPCAIAGCKDLAKRSDLCRYHQYRKYSTGDAGTPLGFRSAHGREAEEAVAELLRSYGRVVKRMGRRDKFDLLVDGNCRIEVKSANAHLNVRGKKTSTKIEWSFNIHRHKVLSEEHVDLYVLRLLQVPHFPEPIYLLLPSPLGTKVFRISLRGLLLRHQADAENFIHFAKGDTVRIAQIRPQLNTEVSA